MLDIKENQHGNLHLAIPELSDRVELLSTLLRHSHASVWADLLEPYSCNGSYTPVDPEVWFVGLTSDPYILVAEAYPSEEGDQLEVNGGLWSYPDYMLSDVVERLIVGEIVVLKRACDFENGKLERT